MSSNDFDNLSLEWLRQRRSEKWRSFPPDVLPAFVAEMDFALAPSIQTALHNAIDNGDCGYASVAELSPVVAEYVRSSFGLQLDVRAIFTVPDVMAGIAQALHALTPPGSAIVINPPVYPPFFEVIRTSGRTISEVPLRKGSDGAWQIDMEGLERAFAAGARGYLLCSPHNPVGRVWSADEVRAVAALSGAHGVVTIADEIHAPLALPGATFTPLLSCAVQTQSCVSVLSASKAWNIAGLKCASLIAGNESVRRTLAARLKEIPTEIASRVGHLGLLATIAAYREEDAWLDGLRSYLSGNRQLLGELLRTQLPEVTWCPPQATYLAWLDCSQLGIGSDPATYFLEHGRVALEPGHRFGTGGETFVRLNFGTSRAILTEIVERMASALRGQGVIS